MSSRFAPGFLCGYTVTVSTNSGLRVESERANGKGPIDGLLKVRIGTPACSRIPPFGSPSIGLFSFLAGRLRKGRQKWPTRRSKRLYWGLITRSSERYKWSSSERKLASALRGDIWTAELGASGGSNAVTSSARGITADLAPTERRRFPEAVRAVHQRSLMWPLGKYCPIILRLKPISNLHQ